MIRALVATEVLEIQPVTYDVECPTRLPQVASEPFALHRTSLSASATKHGPRDRIEGRPTGAMVCGIMADSPGIPQAISASPTPPTVATMTTTQGGAFHAISRTKQASASAKSRTSPMALVKTGE